MVEHGSSVSKLKEILKASKSVKKSDEILDDLFSSIKKEASSPSEEDGDDESNSEDSTESERRKHKKHKKEKKKKHKKVKKKKRRRSDSSDEDEVSRSRSRREGSISRSRKEDSISRSRRDGSISRSKKEDSISRSRKNNEERIGDSFWGNSKPYSEPVERFRRDVIREERDRPRAPYERRREVEYTDERRPVDLGRTAKPYPEPAGRRPVTGGHQEVSRDQYRRDGWVREEYDRGEGRERRRERTEYTRDRDRRSGTREEVVTGKGKEKEGGKDAFWDTKWDAMELDNKIKKAEDKGQYYLNTKKRFKEAMGEEGTPSLSPSPERQGKKQKRASSEEPETEEMKGLRKLRDIQNLKVDGDGMVKGVVPDSKDYEYDKVTRMYKKKDNVIEEERKNKGYVEDTKDTDTKDNKDNKEKIQEDNKSPETQENKTDVPHTDVNPLDSLEVDKVLNPTKDKLVNPAKFAMNKAFPRAAVGKKIEAMKTKSENQEDIMEELVKEIEELENVVDNNAESKVEIKKEVPSIDWSNSALGHLQEPEKDDKKESKCKNGEVIDEVEDGEVTSDSDEDSRKKYTRRSRSRSRSRTRRRSYSRSRRNSRERYSRRRSRSYDRSSRNRRDYSRDRSPYSRSGFGRRDRYDRSYSRDRDRRSYSKDRDRSRSRDRRRKNEEDRYQRNKRRVEKHERSKINKERLLEIAKKNAAKILKSGGDFMGMDQNRLIAMKTGGQSLDEITKFCKEISKKGLESETKIDLLAESESSEEEFHHPFMVKDRPLPNPITMLIGESRETLPPAARAVAKSQRMLEFPVSSGNAHRSKEGMGVDPLGDWEPVTRKPIEMTNKEKEEMEKFHDQIEQEERDLKKMSASVVDAQFQEAMEEEMVAGDKPWTLAEEDKNIAVPKSDIFKAPVKELSATKLAELEQLKPKPVAPIDSLGHLALPAPSARAGTPAPPTLSTNPEKVFDTHEGPVVDIGTIVSTRLNAMRKLQANPTDAQALADMYEAQKMMTSWASSKNKPGQFMGSTGATILSKHELNLGLQCWAKPDQFTKAEKVKGGFGEFMLKKMGWTDGEGLGKNKSGEVNPLQLDIKFDKKGLMAAEEGLVKRGGGVVTMTACKDLSGKHPVSALTELCSKRRWGPPIFTQAFECGPPHKKQYVFKVNVNGTDYQPTVAVNDKKKAKMNAAMSCLQTMGLLPRDPDNPV